VSCAVDTNILLRTTDTGEAAQPIAEAAMIALRRRGESLSIFPQNLIEFWAVATRPLVNNGLGLSIAQTELQLNKLKTMFVLLYDTPEVYSEWERMVVRYQVSGKQTHDAHLVAAMKVHDITSLLTFNVNDFTRFAEITVVNPRTLME
jgi:predicted nucleic acid-binding protein